MRAAREVFAQRGYDRSTPAAVAHEAGVTRTALYHYFGSKADLYRAVLDDINIWVFDELFDLDQIDDPVASMARVLRGSAERNAADPSYGRFLSTMLVDALRNPEFAPLAEAEVARTREFFAAALAAAGPLDGAEELVELLVAVQWGLGLYAAFMGDADEVRRMTERLIRLIELTVNPPS